MRKTISFWLFTICFMGSLVCSAQESHQIPAPKLELKDNVVYITYDILNSHPSETFNVDVEIRDSKGKLINARSLDGDVGQNVSGGMNKRIFWNLDGDKIAISGEIFVTLYAEKTSRPFEEEGVSESSAQEFTRASLLLRSVVLPGWGLTKVTGKPHWIKGVAAYGCLGASIALNRAAISTYEDFLSAENSDEAEALYTKSTSQDKTSEILGYAAIGIWVIDLVWTFVGTSSKGNRMASLQGVSVGGAFDATTGAPQLQLSYRF